MLDRVGGRGDTQTRYNTGKEQWSVWRMQSKYVSGMRLQPNERECESGDESDQQRQTKSNAIYQPLSYVGKKVLI